MTFAQELILFLCLCVVLRVSGTVLDFIAKWASQVRRDIPEPLGQAPPTDEAVGGPKAAGRLEMRHSH